MSIRTRISLLVIPLVLLPLCIVGFFSFNSLTGGFHEQCYLADKQLSMTVSTKIEQLLDECNSSLLMVSSILSNRLQNTDEKPLEALMYAEDNPIADIVSALTIRYSPFLKIRIISPYGKELFVMQSGKPELEPGSALDEDIFLQTVTISGQFPPVKNETDGSWITTFSQFITYEQSLVGFVYFDLDINAIKKILQDINNTRPGYYYLFDGSGAIVADAGTIPLLKSSPEYKTVQASIQSALTKQQHAFTHYPEQIGEHKVFFSVQPVREYISFIEPIPEERWYLGVVHSETPLQAAFSKSILLFWVVLGAGVIVAFAGTLFISDAITNPIRRLTSATRDFARGNLDSKVDVGSHDEIGRLTIAFNTMALEIKQLMKERQANESVVAIGRFTAALAHDLRNPVEGMKLLTSELKKRVSTTEPEREIADTIAQAVDNLSVFINKSLDFARLTKPRIEPANLAELADDILKDFNIVDIELKKEFSCDLPVIEVDIVQIKRVMSNLIANAIDACRQHKSPSGCQVQFKIAALTDNIQIEVVDNGTGIEPEVLDKIYEPFYSTKPEGHGLGLALVRQIISNHGGTITVNSEVKKGSHFIVAFPIKREHIS